MCNLGFKCQTFHILISKDLSIPTLLHHCFCEKCLNNCPKCCYMQNVHQNVKLHLILPKKPFPSRGHLSGNQNQNQNPDLPDALHAGFGELGGIVPWTFCKTDRTPASSPLQPLGMCLNCMFHDHCMNSDKLTCFSGFLSLRSWSSLCSTVPLLGQVCPCRPRAASNARAGPSLR